MKIKEENVSVIIDSLIARIKSLECDVWFRDEKIAKLKAELEAKGGAGNA
jgi:hypothetical protein